MVRFFKGQLLLWAASVCFSPFLFTRSADPGFEILSHRASLVVSPRGGSLSCVDTMSIRLLATRKDEIDLTLLRFYEVSGVRIDGKRADFIRGQDLLRLTDLPSDTVMSLVVSYSGILTFVSEFTKLDADRAILREEEVLPGGPRAYRFVRISVTVPEDWDVYTAGGVVARLPGPGSLTVVSEEAEPLGSIGWICAGHFWTASDSTGGFPVSVHMDRDDTARARRVIRLAKDVLEFYGRKFSPYRFRKLDIIEVADWVAGRNVMAIAPPSLVMVKRLAFETTDAFNQAEAVLPHEIAHQWWPSTVFIRDDHAFLTEGMCEYSSYLYHESSGRYSVRDSFANHPLLRPLLIQVARGTDVPLMDAADLRSMPTQYLKASYVHHMLRRVMGDGAFLRLYRDFASEFALKEAGINDFQRLAERISGKALSWFFDEWVRRKGAPRLKLYNVKSLASAGTWTVRGRVRIVGYEHYTTPVAIGVRTAEGLRNVTVALGDDSAGVYHNDMPFEVVTPIRPLRVILDPEGDLLKLQKLAVRFADLRAPSDGVMIVGTMDHSGSLLERARRDSALMAAIGWGFLIKTDREATLHDLQNDRVFLYGRPSESLVVADEQKRFPYGFRGDTLLVGGESLTDSSLALLQIIDNPFQPGGFICWVAPGSEHARSELLPYDCSWVLLRAKEVVSSGTWEVKDEDLVVELK